MGPNPISSHFFPLAATIGRETAESNAREEKIFNGVRDLRGDINMKIDAFHARKIN